MLTLTQLEALRSVFASFNAAARRARTDYALHGPRCRDCGIWLHDDNPTHRCRICRKRRNKED